MKYITFILTFLLDYTTTYFDARKDLSELNLNHAIGIIVNIAGTQFWNMNLTRHWLSIKKVLPLSAVHWPYATTVLE